MTLCRKALWRLTSGGLSTSSEVERLVPSSHTTAEEEETGLIYVWIHVNTMLLGPFYLHPMFSPGNPREIVKSISRKTWLREHLQNKHKNCVSKQQSIDKYKEKGKSPNLQITWHLNVKYKSVLFTDTLKTIQYLPKLQITMTWHRGRRFSALTQATSKSIKHHLTQAWSHLTFRWISSKYRRSWLPALPSE